jgi:CRP/FNR family transcriptional regulator
LEADHQTIQLKITREDIANLAGTTRETATRILYEMQEEKLIALDGKKIKLLNETGLTNIAF